MNEFSLSSLAREAPGLLSGQYWAELRIFAEVARAKSFNRAAERLGLSQPTIGRKVRRLQDVIGAQLFVTTKQGVRLTQRGEELAEALLEFDRSLFSIATDLKARDKDAEGVVRVSVSDGMAAIFAAPAIPAFHRALPAHPMHLRGIRAFGELSDGQTDMMLTMVPAEQANLTCRKLGTLHFVPVAAGDYLSAIRTTIALDACRPRLPCSRISTSRTRRSGVTGRKSVPEAGSGITAITRSPTA